MMSLHPFLIFALVLTVLLYAATLLLYRRKGMRTKMWYVLLFGYVTVLLFFVLFGFFGLLSEGGATYLLSPGALGCDLFVMRKLLV
jgi:glycopeptide antibiotics resistance protein